MCMCVHGFISFLIDLLFFHIFPMFMFIFIYLFIWTYYPFFQVTKVLSIISPFVLPFQKKCGNCHVADVTISPMGGVYYNACCSNSTIQKLNFLHASIITHDELVLLIIEGKWLETIVYMTKLKFLDLPHLKQIQLFIFNLHSS